MIAEIMVRAYSGRNRPGISTVGVVIVIVLILIVAGAAGYYYLTTSSGGTTTTKAKGSVIKIGMTLSQSGTFASLDGNYTKFNTAWANWVNSQGGLADASGVKHNVTIVWYDDQSQHDLAVSQYHKLAEQDNVSVLVSPYSADIGKDLIPIAQADKVPIIMAEASTASMWVPSNPHDWAVTSMVPYWQVNFTTGWSGSYFSMLKQKMSSNSSGSAPKTIAFVGWDITWATDDYNSSLHLAPKAGLTVVYQKLLQPDFTNPIAGFQAIIPDLKAANPDIVYLATFGPVAGLWMKAANQSGFQPKQWHSIEWGAAFSPIVGQSLSSHTTTEVFWTPAFSSQTGTGFTDESLFNTLLKNAGVTWYQFQNIELRMIIFEMIANAVSHSTTTTRANLNTALHQLNMPTVSGQLVVKPQGYGTIGLVPVQWLNGQIQTVYPPNLSNSTYAYP
jgi:ABC-type branched-subunit amino acid transport system substrate-binding protein